MYFLIALYFIPSVVFPYFSLSFVYECNNTLLNTMKSQPKFDTTLP